MARIVSQELTGRRGAVVVVLVVPATTAVVLQSSTGVWPSSVAVSTISDSYVMRGAHGGTVGGAGKTLAV